MDQFEALIHDAGKEIPNFIERIVKRIAEARRLHMNSIISLVMLLPLMMKRVTRLMDETVCEKYLVKKWREIFKADYGK